MTASNAFISIQKVDKYFGSFQAIDDISMDIAQGEFFSLLGPSGCGKTTMMRMLAGFETPSSGTILIDGQNMNDVPPYERPVNMMFQSYAVFPHMNVADNVAYGLRVRRLPGAELKAKTMRALELVDLEADLSEKNNLAEKNPDLAEKLAQRLRDWRKSVGANRSPGGAKRFFELGAGQS